MMKPAYNLPTTCVQFANPKVVHELLEKPTVISQQHRTAAEMAVTSARLRAQVGVAMNSGMYISFEFKI